MLRHGFAFDQLAGIVVLECERIFRARAFELDFADAGKEFFWVGFHVNGFSSVSYREQKLWRKWAPGKMDRSRAASS
jgi:hypothetical protein